MFHVEHGWKGNSYAPLWGEWEEDNCVADGGSFAPLYEAGCLSLLTFLSFA